MSFDDRSHTIDPGGTPPPRKGMKPTTKWLLIIGGLGLVSCCLVCGVAGYLMTPTISEDPIAAKAALDKIAPGIDVPDDLQPAMAMEMNMFFVMDMNFAILTASGEGQGPEAMSNSLMLMQMGGSMADNPQMRQSAIQQSGQQGANSGTVIGTETKTIEREDGSVLVTIHEIREKDGQLYRQANGTIDAAGGPLMFFLRRPKDDFNFEEVEQMVLSVKGVTGQVGGPGVVEDDQPLLEEVPDDEAGLDEASDDEASDEAGADTLEEADTVDENERDEAELEPAL